MLPSYLSRILSGERVPTWNLTRKFARACGADPDVLRTVWESEKLSEKSRGPATADPDEPPMPATEQLRAAIHTLHLRAGRPAPNDVAVASRWLLSAGAVASVLETTVLPHQAILETFVRILGGDVHHFNRLLDNARTEASQESGRLQPSTQPTPHPSPAATLTAQRNTRPTDTDPHHTQPIGADAVMKTFSKVLTEDQTVEDGRARLLQKLAKQHATPVRKKDGTHPRPTGALKHRLTTPAITPSKPAHDHHPAERTRSAKQAKRFAAAATGCTVKGGHHLGPPGRVSGCDPGGPGEVPEPDMVPPKSGMRGMCWSDGS